MKILSKSSYCNGLQCPKILWLKTHCPEEEQISEKTQKTFDRGHTVGDYAKKYFGEYVEVPIDFGNFSESFKTALENTKSLIEKETPTVCEAAFSFNNTICFADILRVKKDGTIEIIEVKQTSGVRPQHIDDMAFQYYVIKNCGYNISKVSLMHINTSYVRRGDIEPKKFFHIEDCTEKVIARQKEIPAKIEKLLQYSEQTEEPEMETGWHCSNPYQCVYWEHCHKIDENHECCRDAINRVSTTFGNTTFNKTAILGFLSKIRFPLYFFDFETTCMEPLPPVDGASPYHPMPYQYSLHIQNTKEENINTLEHREFLANEFSNSAMRALAEQLCRDIPKDAMVMAYNTSFEKVVIKRLAHTFPDLKEHLMAIHGNFIDLMKPFQSKYLQTPEMEGKYSIKKVLPALVPELVYTDLDVQNGEMAYDTFNKLQHLSPEEREEKRKALLAYCKLDTFAMVRILRELERWCEGEN
jgi:hypothetical protein